MNITPKIVGIVNCGLCDRIIPCNRTRVHHKNQHSTIPFKKIPFKPTGRANYFIKCKICANVIPSSKCDKEYHLKKHHPQMRMSALFNENDLILDRWINCSMCRRNLRESIFKRHLKEEHPNEAIEMSNENDQQTSDIQINEKYLQEKLTWYKLPVIAPAEPLTTELLPEIPNSPIDQSSIELYVRCEYCGIELLPEQIDKHIQQEHVTDVEDDDDDDNNVVPDTTGNSVVNQTNVKIENLVATHTNCDQCSKRVRINKMAKHIRRKHSVESSKKSKRKRKLSVTSSTGTEREIDSTNGSTNETEYYTIFVSKIELQKFLNHNRIYPKDGQFYLKDD